jgi:hypothetical protein
MKAWNTFHLATNPDQDMFAPRFDADEDIATRGRERGKKKKTKQNKMKNTVKVSSKNFVPYSL